MSEKSIEDRDVAFLLLGRIVNGQVPGSFTSDWVLRQGWFGIDSMQNVNLGAYMLCQFGFIKPSETMPFRVMATLETDSRWDIQPYQTWHLPHWEDSHTG